jgi:hypothetical protein
MPSRDKQCTCKNLAPASVHYKDCPLIQVPSQQEGIEGIVEEISPLLKWPSNQEGNENVRKLYQALSSLTEAHKVKMERLVKEIILKAEIHMSDGAWVYYGDIKTIANKFNIEVK